MSHEFLNRRDFDTSYYYRRPSNESPRNTFSRPVASRFPNETNISKQNNCVTQETHRRPIYSRRQRCLVLNRNGRDRATPSVNGLRNEVKSERDCSVLVELNANYLALN